MYGIQFKIANCKCGYNSKKYSFKSIYQSINPTVITINEVGFKKDKKLSLLGYNCYNVAIRNNEAGFALKTAEGKDDEEEFIITRHAQFIQPINILNIYGSQEGRNSKDNIEEKWDIILEKISGIERVNEEIIIITKI